jgi:tetratricopeptide (TPR) repeat protein
MTDPIARILDLLRAGDLDGAAALARNAIAGGMVHPLLFDVRGHAQERGGHYEAAIADFERAWALAAGNPALPVAIARCLFRLDRNAEAAAACDRAIGIDPRFAPAHYNKGYAEEVAGDLVLARHCYQQAAKLDPGMALAHARLAALAARRSDWAQTQMLAEKALALEPGNSIATFAAVTASLGVDKTEGLDARLRAVLAMDGLTAQERANALNLQGDIFDRQDRTAEAFAAYAAANAELARAAAERFDAPGIETGRARIARLTRDFADIDTARWRTIVPGGDAPCAGHVFVLGFYRAGTTLLGQILASHSAVVTLEEKPVLIEAVRDLLDAPSGLARLADLGEAGAAAYRDTYWRRVRGLEPDIAGKIVVDKLPLNTISLPVIAKLFPQARIVFALRDPRDVVFSCFRRFLNMNRDTYELLALDRGAQFYGAVMELAALYRAGLPLALMALRNEDLVADFENQVRALCDFLGIGWKASMARFGEQSKSRSIATPSATQVARGITADGIGQWRRYSAELAPIFATLAPWVEKFGYRAQ